MAFVYVSTSGLVCCGPRGGGVSFGLWHSRSLRASLAAGSHICKYMRWFWGFTGYAFVRIQRQWSFIEGGWQKEAH